MADSAGGRKCFYELHCKDPEKKCHLYIAQIRNTLNHDCTYQDGG